MTALHQGWQHNDNRTTEQHTVTSQKYEFMTVNYAFHDNIWIGYYEYVKT